MRGEGGTSVLLLDGDGTATAGECDALLRTAGDGAAELRVSFSAGNADPGVSESDDRRPAREGLISVGDEVRSASTDGGPDFSGPLAVDAVTDPGDLRGIGLSVSRFCERWNDADIVVCFDSLGDLLDHASDGGAFRFTTLLNKRLQAAGATAHFHLDASDHEDSVVNTFASIFDEVVRPDGDAEGEVADPDAETFEASDEQIRRLTEEFDDDRFTVVEGDGRADAGGGGDEVTEASDEEIADIFE